MRTVAGATGPVRQGWTYPLRLIWTLAAKDIVDAIKTKSTLTAVVLSFLMVFFYQYFFVFSATIALLFVTIMIGISMVPSLMVEEKQARTLDALLVSPAAPAHLVAGKAIAGLFYGLLGCIAVFALFGYLILQWWLAILALLADCPDPGGQRHCRRSEKQDDPDHCAGVGDDDVDLPAGGLAFAPLGELN